MVYRLQRALYGLKQAPRAWNKTIDSFFYSKDFLRSHAHPNLYIYRKDGMVTLVILYVDDLVLTGGHAEHIVATKATLTSTFEMTDLGLLHFFLGLEEREMFISQRRYVSELLEAFEMEDARPISSPMDPNTKLSAYDSSEPADSNLYRKLVGSLIWFLNTRLDLSFSVGLLSSFMQNPLKSHWQQGLRILEYLCQSPDVGIWYPVGDGSAPVLQGWSDADWGGDPDTRRSTSGYVFSLGHGAISWSSKRQSTVVVSSIEAEYKAACSATCEAMWMRRLLEELGFPQQKKIVVLSENQSCIAIAKNPVFHARTKHIEIQYHFVRENVLDGTISLEYCSTVDNAADIFTKPLPQQLLISTLQLAWFG